MYHINMINMCMSVTFSSFDLKDKVKTAKLVPTHEIYIDDIVYSLK